MPALSKPDDEEFRKRKRAWDETAAAVIASLHNNVPMTRSKKKMRPRMVWAERLEQLSDPREFKRTYRMSLETFNMVLQKIRPRLVGPDEAPITITRAAGRGARGGAAILDR